MEHEGTGTPRPVAQSFIIKRPRLTKLLDESEARIILLVAPAGYGKTTLAREWLNQWRGPVAWFSVSSASADVAVLSRGIAEELDIALGDADQTTTKRLAALTAVHQQPDALARVLARSHPDWPPTLVLAIDDYHHLATSPAIEAFVGALAQLLPVTFVITSRSRPNWVAPRLAVYGEAFELGATELAMTDEEAREVLRRSKRVQTTTSIDLARGWPAIIGLAAHTETQDLPDEIPARLYEFLAGDLVGSAPPNVQEALAVLAVAGVGDLRTAHDLLGAGSALTIGEAEKRGLLTFGDANHLTLHPLLRDFLIARLNRDPEKLAVLVDRLVPALVTSQRWDECLAVAGAVPEHVFPLEHVLESALDELLSEGRVATVSRWAQLARSARLDAPIVDLAEGEVALRAGDYERALALGSRAAGRIAPAELKTRAQLLAARAAHFAEHRALAAEWFRRAEEAASSNDMRAAAIWGQFIVKFEDESEGLEDALSRFVAATDGSVEHELRSVQGRLLLAIADCNIAGALDAAAGGVALLSLPAEALARLATLNQYAWLLGSAGRYGEALAASDRGLVEAETACLDFAVAHIQLSKGTALVGLRQFSSAQQILAALTRRLQDEPDRWAVANRPLVQAKLQISLGDLGQAEDCLAVAADRRHSPSVRAEYHGYRGLIAAARGFADEGEEWARRSAECSSNVEGASFPAVTRAIIRARMGASSEAVLEQFELALATGHHDSIVTACRACPELVARISRTARVDTLAGILSESRDAALARTGGLRLPRSARHGDGLSPRELEVYELIVQGRTNREISQILFIAESTTKVHVRHILEKLGVRSRVDAVRAWRLDRA
jgi:ATP/maltotriose-dependent transcriptional regulator MalT